MNTAKEKKNIEKWLSENWFKLVIVAGILIFAYILYQGLIVVPANKSSTVQNIGTSTTTTTAAVVQPVQDNSSLATSFICPEDYTSAQAKTDAVAKFISEYQKLFPDSTVADMELFRYQLLVSRDCSVTLENILHDVAPIDTMLRFNGENFGPQTTQFDSNTDVWSAYLTLNGEPLSSPDEELIFNFYLANVWANSSVSAQAVATTLIQNSNEQIDYKFTAPDSATKLPDYFVYSHITYPQQNYGYIYITKVSTIQNNAFSVTYAKKITDNNAANLDSDINNWLLQELTAAKSNQGPIAEVSNIEVDSSWLSYLASQPQ